MEASTQLQTTAVHLQKKGSLSDPRFIFIFDFCKISHGKKGQMRQWSFTLG